ncbi:MAG: indole-3-glycerol phosphate synthase TrpC [Burkholderiales bacterium]|nr:MAG: indole-3-glycerol phosphate synthase TrpC [Burkholderiales bacterium]
MAELADRLKAIIAYKYDEVAKLKQQRSLDSLEADAKAASKPRGFADALLRIAAEDGNALICEVKRKSPSAGDISPGRDQIAVARDYEIGGAACISVLTDGPSFGGSLNDMISVRDAISLPVLRKDFMVDPIQVIEARAAGADAILIIMAAVDDALAGELHATADRLGMSVLLEAHDEAELVRALGLPSPLLGVNNRDLRTFTTDLAVTERLADILPPGKLLISESGVRSAADISRLRTCGARGFLIGETLMRAENPVESVRSMVAAR